MSSQKLLLPLVGGLCIFIALIYVIEANHRNVALGEQAQRTLDDYLQSMSLNKPFVYDITSIAMAESQTQMGNIWCIRFEPPMQTEIYNTPIDPQQVSINHFVISITGPHWSGLMFQNNEQDDWAEMGCKNW